MKTPLLLPALLLASLINLGAATYTETMTGFDSHNLPTTAENLPISGASLDSIFGTISLGSQNTSEEDVYRIYISNPAAFSVTTNTHISFAGSGLNNFDTQLFLFNSSRQGVIENDDTAGAGSGGGTAQQSTIPLGRFTGAAGYYYLTISGAETLPATGGPGGVSIFPNFTEDQGNGYQTTDVAAAKSSGIFNSFNGVASPNGNYRIDLTGAFFSAVPEPSSLGLLVLGLAGYGVRRLFRRN